MREIKFRVRSTEDINGVTKRLYFFSDEFGCLAEFFNFASRNGLNWFEQFTGLKDKNGKEIYGGDIVECDMSYKGGVLPHMGEIVYLEKFGAFSTRNDSGKTLLHNHILSSFNIIGNVYENPELLKGGNCERD